ncbi:MAG: hypothetical protein AAGB51_14040 [Planctomycetota bacterium]
MRNPRTAWHMFLALPLLSLTSNSEGQPLDPMLRDLEWEIRVGAQIIVDDLQRGIGLRNIAAPDVFGAGGPGTAPDFLSDDFLRLTARATDGERTFFAFSSPFQFSQSQSLVLSDLVVTDSPPPLPDFLVTFPAPGQPVSTVLNEIGQTLQLSTTAILGDGTMQDVTNRTEWTVYRTSNPNVASVGPNGLVTAVGAGTCFVNAVNEGATSVLRVIVNPGDLLTTVEGFARFSDGVPAAGATVEVLGQSSMGTTDSNGFFSIPGVATSLGGISVRVTLGELTDVLGPVEPVEAMITDAGLAELTLPTNEGRRFIAVFQDNVDAAAVPVLFLSSQTTTIGEVRIPGLSFRESFSISPGTVTRIDLPPQAIITGTDVVTDLAVLIEADQDLTAYALNQRNFSTDAYAVLPVESLGTSYRPMSYTALDSTLNSQFAIAATDDDTLVTITPASTTSGRAAGVPYTIILNQGEVYQLKGDSSSDDLTGSAILASKPIAVFGGHTCAFVPQGVRACDHLCEQMTPTDTWGRSVATVPLALRFGGDIFRVLATNDNTTVSIVSQGGAAETLTLNAGRFAERLIADVSSIVADQPVLVAQYSRGSDADGVQSDPFMALVPPAEQFLDRYTFTTPSGFNRHFVNIVAPAALAAANGVFFDAAPLDASLFTQITNSAFATAMVEISEGTHSMSATEAFGITIYGFASFDSYGYPGGISLSRAMSSPAAGTMFSMIGTLQPAVDDRNELATSAERSLFGGADQAIIGIPWPELGGGELHYPTFRPGVLKLLDSGNEGIEHSPLDMFTVPTP